MLLVDLVVLAICLLRFPKAVKNGEMDGLEAFTRAIMLVIGMGVLLSTFGYLDSGDSTTYRVLSFIPLGVLAASVGFRYYTKGIKREDVKHLAIDFVVGLVMLVATFVITSL